MINHGSVCRCNFLEPHLILRAFFWSSIAFFEPRLATTMPRFMKPFARLGSLDFSQSVIVRGQGYFLPIFRNRCFAVSRLQMDNKACSSPNGKRWPRDSSNTSQCFSLETFSPTSSNPRTCVLMVIAHQADYYENYRVPTTESTPFSMSGNKSSGS